MVEQVGRELRGKHSWKCKGKGDSGRVSQVSFFACKYGGGLWQMRPWGKM